MAQRAELFIALLKRRAQRILEAHRPPVPPAPVWSVSGAVSEGYESNVNLDGFRKGDYFTEETVDVGFRPTLKPWLKLDANYNLYNSHFQEMTDSNVWSNTWSGAFQIQPHRVVRLDVGAEYTVLNLPNDSDSSYFDRRAKAHVLLAHAPWLMSKLGWTFSAKEYDTQKVLDENAAAVPGAVRQDDRHIGLYELQFRFPKTFARAGIELYRNLSNDRFGDFYDWDGGRLRGALTRLLNERWMATMTGGWERKNYCSRSVSAINMSQRDNLYTLAGALVYQLTQRVTLSYSAAYRYQDSNDPRLDFTDWTNQVGVALSF